MAMAESSNARAGGVRKRLILFVAFVAFVANASLSGRALRSYSFTDGAYLPTAMRLNANPHLGWQPRPPKMTDGIVEGGNETFSWRSCFRDFDECEDRRTCASNLSEGCLEYDLGPPPPPPIININRVVDAALEGVINGTVINGAVNGTDDAAADVGVSVWVPDATMIRTMLLHRRDRNRNPFPPPPSRELCEDFGKAGESAGDDDKLCFREAGIRSVGRLDSDTVLISPSDHYGSTYNGTNNITVPAPRLMCLIYTMENAHANRIRAMRETWAGGCDGFLAFSTTSDPRLPAIAVEHEGKESYSNMWNKVRSMWKFVGQHYMFDYDWFYIGGDDLFAMPQNLKSFLASLAHKDGTDPWTREYFVGRRMNGGRSGYFNYGGPGYVLSRATLWKFVSAMEEGPPECTSRQATPHEDIMIARCLRRLNVGLTDARDARGRERFHVFAPGWHYNWRHPGPPDQGMYYQGGKEWGFKTGKDCCAPDSVSFHYVRKPGLMRHLHALLHSCDE